MPAVGGVGVELGGLLVVAFGFGELGVAAGEGVSARGVSGWTPSRRLVASAGSPRARAVRRGGQLAGVDGVGAGAGDLVEFGEEDACLFVCRRGRGELGGGRDRLRHHLRLAAVAGGGEQRFGVGSLRRCCLVL